MRLKFVLGGEFTAAVIPILQASQLDWLLAPSLEADCAEVVSRSARLISFDFDSIPFLALICKW